MTPAEIVEAIARENAKLGPVDHNGTSLPSPARSPASDGDLDAAFVDAIQVAALAEHADVTKLLDSLSFVADCQGTDTPNPDDLRRAVRNAIKREPGISTRRVPRHNPAAGSSASMSEWSAEDEARREALADAVLSAEQRRSRKAMRAIASENHRAAEGHRVGPGNQAMTYVPRGWQQRR